MKKLILLLTLATTSCTRYITVEQEATITDIEKHNDTTGLLTVRPIGKARPFNISALKVGDTLRVLRNKALCV